MDQNPYRILSCLCLTFTPVSPPKISKGRGWGIASKKHHGDHSLLCGNVRDALLSCARVSGSYVSDTHGAP